MSNSKELEEIKGILDENQTFTESLELDENSEHEEIDFSVDIPKDPTYDDMIQLALKAYKNQMDSVNQIPAKSRSRYLEVAQQYLNIAATALKNKKDHEFKEIQERSKSESDEDETEKTKTGSVSRRDLLEEIQKRAKG